MTQTFEAVFDREVFIPCELLDLLPNTRIRITIEILAADSTDLWRD